jgi:hypothetical protein
MRTTNTVDKPHLTCYECGKRHEDARKEEDNAQRWRRLHSK